MMREQCIDCPKSSVQTKCESYCSKTITLLLPSARHQMPGSSFYIDPGVASPTTSLP